MSYPGGYTCAVCGNRRIMGELHHCPPLFLQKENSMSLPCIKCAGDGKIFSSRYYAEGSLIRDHADPNVCNILCHARSMSNVSHLVKLLNSTEPAIMCGRCIGTGKEPRRYTFTLQCVAENGHEFRINCIGYGRNTQLCADALEFYHRAGCPPVE